MTSGTGSGLVSRNKEGTQIVLAQFPVEGETLTSFGLTPSIIKTIAIPNDIQEWPTSALNDCTNLEQITVFGPEVQEGGIALTLAHNLRNLNKLSKLQLPSTVIFAADGAYRSDFDSDPIFPKNVKHICLPLNFVSIGAVNFFGGNLTSIDLSRSRNLQIGIRGLMGAKQLTSIDLSSCLRQTNIPIGVFFDCSKLSSVILPPTLQYFGDYVFSGWKEDGSERDNLPSLKTLIWKGRSTRSVTVTLRTFFPKSLDDLIANGEIQEIFIP